MENATENETIWAETSKMFLTGPAPDNKIMNMKEVTNIGFEHYFDRNDRETWKIILNFGYPVSLPNDFSKLVSDYQYIVLHDLDEYNAYIDELSNLINNHMWLAPRVNGKITRIINPEKISFVATDTKKNRIIFNLNTSVSFYNNNMRKTSDFLYIDFDNRTDFDNEYKYIKTQLNELTM